jgi:hypothetical protein
MSDKVIVLMDNDGVLNACKTHQVAGYLDAYAPQLDSCKPVTPTTPILKKYNWYLDFSSSVVDYFGALQDVGVVSFSWCSEWCENNDYRQLNEAYGYSESDQVWRAQLSPEGIIDKLATVMKTMDSNPDTPILWIDDEKCDYRAYSLLRDKSVNEGRTTPIMMARPETTIGLSKPQMDMIADFIQYPSGYDRLVFICSPTGQTVKDFADVYSEEVTNFLQSAEWSYEESHPGILRSRSVAMPDGFGVVSERGGVRSWPGYSVRVTETQVKRGVHADIINGQDLEDAFECADVLPECRRTITVSEGC